MVFQVKRLRLIALFASCVVIHFLASLALAVYADSYPSLRAFIAPLLLLLNYPYLLIGENHQSVPIWAIAMNSFLYASVLTSLLLPARPWTAESPPRHAVSRARRWRLPALFLGCAVAHFLVTTGLAVLLFSPFGCMVLPVLMLITFPASLAGEWFETNQIPTVWISILSSALWASAITAWFWFRGNREREQDQSD
jgi:hypothetical protein